MTASTQQGEQIMKVAVEPWLGTRKWHTTKNSIHLRHVKEKHSVILGLSLWKNATWRQTPILNLLDLPLFMFYHIWYLSQFTRFPHLPPLKAHIWAFDLFRVQTRSLWFTKLDDIQFFSCSAVFHTSSDVCHHVLCLSYVVRYELNQALIWLFRSCTKSPTSTLPSSWTAERNCQRCRWRGRLTCPCQQNGWLCWLHSADQFVSFLELSWICLKKLAYIST